MNLHNVALKLDPAFGGLKTAAEKCQNFHFRRSMEKETKKMDTPIEFISGLSPKVANFVGNHVAEIGARFRKSCVFS